MFALFEEILLVMTEPDPGVAQLIDQMAELIGLVIPAECRPGVIENFLRNRSIAQQVLEFPLPESLESAPTFQP